MILSAAVLACFALTTTQVHAEPAMAGDERVFAIAPAGGDTEIAFEGVRNLIDEQMTVRYLPSLAISISQHGRIVWEEGFGWADKEKQRPATPGTMYRIASITKPLTATGLMRLVEAGSVGLDDPVDKYLGGRRLVSYAGDDREATVRRIANHTAGIPHHWQFFYEDGEYPVPSTEETIQRYGIIVRPPGEKYVYSNINYAVLEEVIRHVSGQKYADYMKEQVFMPLGMTHTSIEPTTALGSFLAAGYDQNKVRLPGFKTDYPGGAGAYSSSHDLIRFAMFHLKDHWRDQKQILAEDSIDQMQRPTAQIRPGGSYGIGWRSDTVRGTIEHGGYFPGASAIMRLVPKEDVAVVVLTNISNDDQATALNLIADAALRALIPDWKVPQTQISDQDAPRPVTAVPALAGRWVGSIHTYVSEIPLALELLPDGKGTRVRLGGQPAVSLDIRYSPADSALSGEMRGVLDTPDARRSQSYLLRFELETNANAMTGTVTALPQTPAGGSRLTHWVSLKKQ